MPAKCYLTTRLLDGVCVRIFEAFRHLKFSSSPNFARSIRSSELDYLFKGVGRKHNAGHCHIEERAAAAIVQVKIAIAREQSLLGFIL